MRIPFTANTFYLLRISIPLPARAYFPQNFLRIDLTTSEACCHLHSLPPPPELAADSRTYCRFQRFLPPPELAATSRARYCQISGLTTHNLTPSLRGIDRTQSSIGHNS